MNDKELDSFFRDKAENPEIDYRPEDWERMRQQLENPFPTGRSNGSGKWLISLLILAVLIGGGWGWMSIKKGQVETENAGNSLNTAEEFSPKEISKEEMPSGNLMGSGKKSRRADNGSLPPNKGAALSIGQKSVKRTTAKEGGELINEKMRHGFIKREKITLTTGPLVPIHRPEIMPQFEPIMDRFVSNQRIKRRITDGLKDESRSLNQEDMDLKEFPENTGERPKIKGQKFSLALLLAPDVTALKIKDIAGLGTSIGLNLEYFIHPNFSINTGGLYAFKTYRGGKGYDTAYDPVPTGMSGDCWVLDLPLNVRYYVINQGLGRWYINGGASSYFMLKEKYKLEYKTYGGGSYEKKVEIKNENRHYWSIVNLSVGYERKLSERLAIQVEPYYKLPLKGIGEGGLKLKSAGVLIGLKYTW